MANNYRDTSSWLPLPPNVGERAQEIIDEQIKLIEADDPDWPFCGCTIEVQGDGVWFNGDEYVNVEHVEIIARALVEELEIDEPFYCSWADHCSKARIDEFGGGAFVIQRGKDTFWVDAMSLVHEHVRKSKEKEG